MNSRRQPLGIMLGPCLFLLLLMLPLPGDMPVLAMRTAAVTVLMATWWITEAAPMWCRYNKKTYHS